MILRPLRLAALVIGVVILTSGCVAASIPTQEVAEHYPVELGPATDDAAALEGEAADGTVLVLFRGRDEEFDLGLMDDMLQTELAADAALQEAGAGWIDGNAIGRGEYQLYFIGEDPERMWEIIEPIFADAPIAWSRVELWDGLDDDAPVVITP
ncbi:hypothetical protein [Microbacterium sp. NPDC089696]|uniref:hypothetical protein n=1 Tax=Microbacterium sp. NPDC089696 TaxID=3364199 RepID=UPI00380DBD92